MAVLRAIVAESDALRPIDEMLRQELGLECPFVIPWTATFFEPRSSATGQFAVKLDRGSAGVVR